MVQLNAAEQRFATYLDEHGFSWKHEPDCPLGSRAPLRRASMRGAVRLLLAWPLAAVVLAALPAGPAAAAAAAETACQATLMPAALSPLSVKGACFGPRERVRVTVTPAGGSAVTRRVRAKRSGSFLVRFPGVSTCGGLEGVAVGRRGSRASFQFAAFTCRD